jgi:hypothetical protein
MDWRFGSSSRMPAFQVGSPKFKLRYHKNKKDSKTNNKDEFGGER